MLDADSTAMRTSSRPTIIAPSPAASHECSALLPRQRRTTGDKATPILEVEQEEEETEM